MRIEYAEYGTQAVDYYVNCFDRTMKILFKDITLKDIEEIEKQLDFYYYEWHDGDTNECCEEYMIDNLSKEYKNKIVAVIYEGEEE